jgi:hypothetical protein
MPPGPRDAQTQRVLAVLRRDPGAGENMGLEKIAGKWMFIPLKMVSIGIDPYPYSEIVIQLMTMIIQESYIFKP